MFAPFADRLEERMGRVQTVPYHAMTRICRICESRTACWVELWIRVHERIGATVLNPRPGR